MKFDFFAPSPRRSAASAPTLLGSAYLSELKLPICKTYLPQGDWRMCAPFSFCAVLQVASMALAVMHLRRHRRAHLHHA
jgi:hypothetical protein